MAQTDAVSWISEKQVAAALHLEPVLVLFSMAIGAWFIYKLLLRDVSQERHRNMRSHFRNLLGHISASFALFLIYTALSWLQDAQAFGPGIERVAVYVGTIAVIWGCVVFIKISRILAFEYLFLGSMRAGVPLLLVNMFTLILSLIVLGWILARLFSIDLTPLLATSAIFSIVLGLALQDTLGNLFAGIAMQFDKPFELGDWIEVKGGGDKIVGQVYEISWRATVLLAITDELITIPNRNLAQWQVSNFAAKTRPFIRSYNLRLPFTAPLEEAKTVLMKTMESIPGILLDPAPVVIVTDTTESWVTIKAVYYLRDYGSQYGIADRFLSRALEDLHKAGIEVATSRLAVDHRPASPTAA